MTFNLQLQLIISRLILGCFYCHYQYQGGGVGRQICKTLERQAIQLQLTHLLTRIVTYSSLIKLVWALFKYR